MDIVLIVDKVLLINDMYFIHLTQRTPCLAGDRGDNCDSEKDGFCVIGFYSHKLKTIVPTNIVTSIDISRNVTVAPFIFSYNQNTYHSLGDLVHEIRSANRPIV